MTGVRVDAYRPWDQKEWQAEQDLSFGTARSTMQNTTHLFSLSALVSMSILSSRLDARLC